MKSLESAVLLQESLRCHRRRRRPEASAQGGSGGAGGGGHDHRVVLVVTLPIGRWGGHERRPVLVLVVVVPVGGHAGSEGGFNHAWRAAGIGENATTRRTKSNRALLKSNTVCPRTLGTNDNKKNNNNNNHSSHSNNNSNNDLHQLDENGKPKKKLFRLF